jgi:hypothetical protein
MSLRCVHAAGLAPVTDPLDVCQRCIKEGSDWAHLRQCLVCGQTLCCNDSPKKHMTGHYHEVGHPVMRNGDLEDPWTWCFADEAMIRDTPDGWEGYDPFVVNGIGVAGWYLAHGGSVRPSPDFVTENGLPLGDWFAYVRELHESGDLDPIDEAVIEGLPGWAW